MIGIDCAMAGAATAVDAARPTPAPEKLTTFTLYLPFFPGGAIARKTVQMIRESIAQTWGHTGTWRVGSTKAAGCFAGSARSANPVASMTILGADLAGPAAPSWSRTFAAMASVAAALALSGWVATIGRPESEVSRPTFQ
jgi:hypothetical protein